MALGVILNPRKPREGWACLTCGDWFPKDEHRKFEKHVKACAEVNSHIERDLSPRSRLGIFGGMPNDGEYERWVKRNARAIIERRVRM